MQTYTTKISKQNQIQYKNENGRRQLYGYASTFNHRDRDGDIVMPGAFKDVAAKEREYIALQGQSRIKLLWQHQSDKIIGKINNIVEDTKGLLISAELLPHLQYGQQAIYLIEQGILDSLSIGFQVMKHFYSKNARYLKEIELYEISLVTFPANNKAKLLGWV